MATEKQQEDSVLIRLSVIQPGSLDYPERRILLTESEPTAKLGRSSSRPSLGLQPAVTNGWYNSPVMSRHHAELEADFANETVGITDLGSMHGTFLNKTKIGGPGSRPTRIRAGDELTLGLPVFRNREEFHPALMRVDGFEFCKASRRPTTTPTRIFTVPDDCSTDDNEPMDENYDEPTDMAPSTDANGDIVMEQTGDLANPLILRPDTHPTTAEHSTPACGSNAGLSHQLDGADDIPSPDGALSRPGMAFEGWSEVSSFNGSSICNGSAGPSISVDNLTNLEHDQDMDSLHNIEPGNDPGMQIVSCGDESRSPSWNSFSSDSEDEHMDNESALDESASEGFALFEDDSDEMADETVVDGKLQPDTGLDSEEQTEHNLQAPSREAEVTHASVLPNPVRQLPPISSVSVISRGPNNWISCLHNNWGPRSPSPSDAVLLPRHRRRDATNSDKAQVDAGLDTPGQAVPEVQGGDVDDSRTHVENPAQEPERVNTTINITKLGVANGDEGDFSENHTELDDLTLLGQKSGKAEFFAARAVNKRVHDANMRIDRLCEASPLPKLGCLPIPSKNDCHAEDNVPSANTSELADSSSNFILTPCARGLIGEAEDRDTFQRHELVDSQRRLPHENEYPYGLEATAWSSPDPDFHESSSAYEWQNLKSKLQASTALGSASKASRDIHVQNAYKTMGHIARAPEKADPCSTNSCSFEQLEHDGERLDEHDTSVSANDIHNTKKGKRKAAEISEESSTEFRWDFSSKDKNKALRLSDALPSSSHSAARSTSDQRPLPSPPPSPEEVANPEQRPTKKIKRIAERVGYAALGGVSVGAMVLTSLIYTAPNFG